MSTPTTPQIVVVGAGCIGLAVGIQLLHAGYRVHLVTNATTPNITSDGAGALWRPFGHNIEHQREAFARWSSATFEYLVSMYQRYGTIRCGIVPVSGFQVTRTSELNDVDTIPYWSKIVTGFRRLTTYELEHYFPLPNGSDTSGDIHNLHLHSIKDSSSNELESSKPRSTYQSGYFFTSMAADMSIYLQFLTNEFTSLGGKITIGEITSFKLPFSSDDTISNILKSATMIINCTGMASRTLCNDLSVRPARGYVLRVHAPHIHHFVMDDDQMAYIFPRNETVVLGGTYDLDSWDLTLNEETRADIRRRCKCMIPNIENAPIVNEWVGLRPTRPWVRLETEIPHGTFEPKNSNSVGASSLSAHQINSFTENTPVKPVVPPAGCSVPLIHCYGHGGSGVTLHWGCAKDVVDLALSLQSPEFHAFNASSSSHVSAKRVSSISVSKL